ncbi:hypothetical protein [Streptomyces sp. 900105755]
MGDPQQMHGCTHAGNDPLRYSDPAGTEIGTKPHSCQYDVETQQARAAVGYDPKAGTGDHRCGDIYKRAHARHRNLPASVGRGLQRYFFSSRRASDRWCTSSGPSAIIRVRAPA